MKRAPVAALLISLVAGSTAFAGTVLPPGLYNRNNGSHNERGHQQQRPDPHNDDRGRHDNAHRNNPGNNWNHRDDHRWDGRRDDHRRDNDRHWNGGRHFDGRSDNRRWASPPPRYVSPPRHDYRWENGRWRWGSYSRPYGYAPHYWRRGERLPVAYYGPRYVIGNYYDCGLRAPPYGYHWVRVDHDVVLAAIATGVVLDVIYNRFW